jgi:hypothetical protein
MFLSAARQLRAFGVPVPVSWGGVCDTKKRTIAPKYVVVMHNYVHVALWKA